MKVILCNKSNVKEEIIKKWFKDNLKLDIDIEKRYIENDLLPPQPIGEDIKLICLKKINDLKDTILSNDINYIISIDNFIEILEDKLIYKLCICVYNFDKNDYKTKINEGVDLDIEIINEYPNFLSIIKDLKSSYINSNKKYMFNGCKEKLFDIVNNYYPEIPKNNIIKILKNNNYDKFYQISLLLKEIFV
jgi:hypothetical protein